MRRRKRRDFPPYTKDRDIDIITPLFEAAFRATRLMVRPPMSLMLRPTSSPMLRPTDEPKKAA